ncbi:1921a4ad-1d63-4288-875f-3b95cdde6ee7 [Sclerotinia trifoliorum]|uniref:1921a4ad-1d63-4288-875f-3b95cdde6ee7 n=1 Tax=Sclerotinia trifoliorum TaxID=28548 RepID=A0A8H2VUC1_9HELO|nr:1921a4ad-1d63-4288-875f-3b95cdde6ee7 [Sclerotinia trifoliorum]
MSEEKRDFHAWAIETSDHDRKIEFRGELILIYNETTKHTPVDKLYVNSREEFIIPKHYKCKLHGAGMGSFARLHDKIEEQSEV